jgi:Tfp pilus assembly protein PilZ
MVRYGTRQTDKTAFTRNISERGLFLQTNSVLMPGSTIQVRIQLPDREFHMWAKVRWAKKAPTQLVGIIAAGMGIKFIEPPPEWLDYFNTHLKR